MPEQMRPATPEQADLLRALRPFGTTAAEALEEVSSRIARFRCPHERPGDKQSEHMPETCPTCALYSILCEVIPLVGDFNKDLDAYLERAEVRENRHDGH